jgi:hypothetical protein
MRNIKFRALSLVNNKCNNIKVGDFVYGCYIESDCDAPCIILINGAKIEINKATLGQLTCLNDKNGKHIYEGDNLNHKNGYIWTVIFDEDESRFALKCKPPLLRPLHKTRGENCEIIGNVHQS